MWRNRVDVWRNDIVGDWQPERRGVDLLYLEPTGQHEAQLSIRADGTWGWPHSDGADLPPRLRWPWELSDDLVLSMWTPVAPMPEHDQPEWSREEKQWLVLAVTPVSLAIADSHQVVIFRRVNREEYDRRKAAEYSRLLEAVRPMGAGGPTRS